jgi:hypothetical protein
MESDHLEDPGVEARIRLKWIHNRWETEAWTGLSWLRIGSGGGRCNEPSGSINCGEFLD